MQLTYHLAQINELAEKLWVANKGRKVWALYAPMGAGKTTLIKAICNHVLQSTDIVCSPTFAIINEYETPTVGRVYHMDWYRLADEDEAVGAGVEDILTSDSLCFVEWPERAPLLLPSDALYLQIEILSETERQIFEK